MQLKNERVMVCIQHTQFVLRTGLQDFKRADLFKQASAMAYVTLLSIVPSLAAIFSLISVFKPALGKDGQLTATIENFIVENLAQGTGDQVAASLTGFIADLDFTKIGVTSVIGLLVALVLLLRQIEGALNRIWKVDQNRNVITRFIYFWTFLTLGSFVFSMAVGLTSGFNFRHMLPTFIEAEAATNSLLFESFVGLCAGTIFFFFLFKIVPNRSVTVKAAGLGAMIASFLFQFASKGFSFYVSDVSGHKSIYGALAALPLFLMWLYICWIIILLGGLIAWRIQEGLPEKQDDPRLALAQTACDKLYGYRVRSILPFALLVLIYKDFKANEGRGLSGEMLHKDFGLPSRWIAEALEVLVEGDYILYKSPRTGLASLVDYAALSFFPCMPADALSLNKLQGEIYTAIDAWPKYLESDFEAEVCAFMKKFSDSLAANAQATLQDIL